MMKKIALALLLMLLLPSVVAAKGFKVNKPQKFQQPINTIDRVSLRTLTSKIYQDSAHFNAGDYERGPFITKVRLTPVHYDSAGKMVEINYTSTPDNGYQVVNAGRFTLRYKPTGEIRFSSKRGGAGFVSFIPAFDTTDVGIEFNIHAHGLKANYYLDQDSPNRLAWGFDFTSVHENQGQGKGRIKNAVNKVVAELGELKAWDAAGMVVDITVTYTADSLTVLVDTAGVTFPVTLDPTVQDSLVPATSYATLTASNVGAGWPGERNTVTSNSTATLWSAGAPSGSFLRQYNTNIRNTYTFPLDGLSGTITISSMTFTLPEVTVPEFSPMRALLVKGTFDGTPGNDWYNDLENWKVSGDYGTVPYTDTLVVVTDSLIVVDFTAAAIDSTEALVLAGDSLKLMMLTVVDASFDSLSQPLAQQALWKGDGAEPFVTITYTSGPTNLPRVITTAEDTLGVTALTVFDKIVVQFDSSGSGLDSVGAAWVVKGQAPVTDTIFTVTDSASGDTWTLADSTFVVTSPATLDLDTLYEVTAFAVTDGEPRTFSDVGREISTYLNASTVTPSTSQIVWTVVELAANVTAFGTTPVTVRGIAYFLNQENREADVDTSLDGGSSPFAAGVFSLEVTVPVDTFVIYRGLATTVTGDAVSIWDTLRTTAEGTAIDGVPITVMGLQGTRSVN